MAKATKLPAPVIETQFSGFGIKQVAEILETEAAERESGADLSEDAARAIFFDSKALLWMVPWKEYGFDYCGVYLIGPQNRWPLKIGISERVYARINTLQTAHWSRIDCHGYWICENRAAAAAVEKKAHEMLKDTRHLMGEWFDVDIKKATEVVIFAAQSVGVEMVADIPRIKKFRKVHSYLEIAGPSWRRERESKPQVLNIIDLKWAMNKPWRDKKARDWGLVD